MSNPLLQFIQDQKHLLEKGEVLTAILNDGVATIYNETDGGTKGQKTVTLLEPCNTKLDCKIDDLKRM
jgi:hypothetical protein